MYGHYKTKIAVGASVALCAGLAFFFPAGGVVAVPLALSSAALLVCGEDFRATDNKKIRRARAACTVATVLNVPLFFFILWLIAVQTPLWLMALFMPLANLMQVHQVSMGLKGLGPQGSLPHRMGQDRKRNAMPGAPAGPDISEENVAAEATFIRLMTEKYGFSEAQARAIDGHEKQGFASRAAYWAAQGWTPEERAGKAFEERAAASYARNPAIRNAPALRTGVVKHLRDRWGWIGLLIWAPLAVCGTLVFLRGEFTAAYGTKVGMTALLLLSVLYAAYVLFGRMRRGLALRLTHTTWLGMAGMGATIVLGPFLLLLPALYGGAYVVHRTVAAVHTESHDIKVQQGRGRYRYSHYAVVGERIKFCFRPQHAEFNVAALTLDISRSPLGASAAAYYLDGLRYETACPPQMLPSRRG